MSTVKQPTDEDYFIVFSDNNQPVCLVRGVASIKTITDLWETSENLRIKYDSNR